MKCLSALLVTITIVALAPASASARTTTLAIVHVTAVDATRVRPDVTVVVARGRIVAVGPAASTRVPRGARVVDATGAFLIPGLWDMHAHLGDEPFDRDDALALFVANGVTGVRVMAGEPAHHEWRRTIRAGRLLGPTMIIASRRADESKTTPAEARRLVRTAKREGADVYKVYDDLSRDAYFAVIDEAKRVGLPVVGHVPRSVTIVEAAAAGQRTVEHFTGLDGALTNEVQADTIAAMLARFHVRMCPTLVMRHGYAALDVPDVASDPRLAYAKPDWREWWSSLIREASAFPAGEMDRRRALVASEDRLLARLHAAGVGVLAGTDVGACPFGVPGFSLQDELVRLVDAGLSPDDALRAATIEPARLLGRGAADGTIARGARADLVLLDGNPLEDIKNVRRIRAVVLAGRLLDRAELDGILERVRREATRLAPPRN